MKMHRRWIILFVGLLLFSGTLHALASNREAGPVGEGGPGLHYLLIKAFIHLNLTDAQKHEIAVVLKLNRDETRSLMRKMMEARKELMDLSMADPLNEEAVRQAARQVAGHGEELAVKRARVFQEIKKVLTPEQQSIIQELRSEVAAKGKEKWRARGSLLDEWIDAHSK